MTLSLDDYDFALPADRIAQQPLPARTQSRLLAWRADGTFEHLGFDAVSDLVQEGDLLVLNDTRVFPARLRGTKLNGTAQVEVLLVQPGTDGWEALVRPGRRLPAGTAVLLEGGLQAEIGAAAGEGLRQVRFPAGCDVQAHCAAHGHVPLPPYIQRADHAGDLERYQTVFARLTGSVAAPTAGLHFDAALLDRVRERGARVATVTLHVGPGTFRPLEEGQLRTGLLHPEWREVPGATLAALKECRQRGGRIIAVGTTVCRSLESVGTECDTVAGPTRLMIAPGFSFRYTDVLITNFHLPRSSLLFLVAALAGPVWREAYALAIAEDYRFYSYGDANWIEARA